jgi:hypothetical protein
MLLQRLDTALARCEPDTRFRPLRTSTPLAVAI